MPFVTEDVPLSQLTPHPRNYVIHPEDELTHIMESIREHGFYKNIVVAEDYTILAGHGVSIAARRLNLETVPVRRLPLAPDHPLALKIVVGDNEIRHLAEVDDRALTELLREINEVDDLLGTGYDPMMVANLAMVTRPAHEIEDMDAAAQWAGMPDYADKGEDRVQIIVNFATEDDRKEFCRILDLDITKIPKEGAAKSIWWPKRGKDDVVSLLFTDREVTSND